MSDAFNFCICAVSQSNIWDTALLLSFPNEHIFYSTIRWHRFTFNWRAWRVGRVFFRLGVELTFRIVNVLLFVKFVSPERLEMKQELSCLNVNKKKKNHKWDVDCGRLCWHIPSLYFNTNLKALECLITALDSERFDECTVEADWSVWHAFDLERRQLPSICLPYLCHASLPSKHYNRIGCNKG